MKKLTTRRMIATKQKNKDSVKKKKDYRNTPNSTKKGNIKFKHC